MADKKNYKQENTLIEKFLYRILGKMNGQPFWETLFGMSLHHMNYGNGGEFEQSGELNVLRFIRNELGSTESPVIFDVGANVGNYSKAIAGLFDSKAIIHSFEPSKKTFELFRNATRDIQNIIPNNFGFSDAGHNQLLYSNAEGSGLASVYQRNLQHFGISMDKTESIQLSTIDNYCEKNNIKRIHFLKLDIEGHELKALSGAKQMISQNGIDFIQFEFGGCNIDSRTYFQDFYYLLKDKYRIYRILKDGLVELPSYKETYEIFIPINYLAVKK